MKISIVMPSLNSGDQIENALASIWRQTYTDYEIVVMDGGSTDGTLEVLRRNGSRIAHWESGPDGGTSEAMNRGFARATGDLVTFFCADDLFKDPRVFEDVVAHFRAHPETEVLCCDLELVDPEDPQYRFVSKSDASQMAHRMSVNMPGAFLRRGVLNERQFSSKVEVANDYELFAYLLKEKKACFEFLNRITVSFSLGGRTNQTWTDFLVARDCFYVRRHYFSAGLAYALYLRDMAVACLRWMNIRPFFWMRTLRRAF